MPGTKIKYFPLLLLISSISFAQSNSAAGSRAVRRKMADEMEYSITHELLNKWYPQCTDTLYGGFLSTYSFDFKPVGPQDKFIVTQGRHVWSTAKAAERYPGSSYYLNSSRQGFHFLRDVMWDKAHGGFYNLVTRQGTNKSDPRAPKDAYGNAFGIYALAAYYKASRDTGALSLARQAFAWLEQHSHDPVHKGYYQHMAMDGTPVVRDPGVPSTSELGYKDQNSSIHLLEAFTELYEVWPDPLLRERLQEMLLLIRDRITTQKGYLQLFFYTRLDAGIIPRFFPRCSDPA